jgi:hypothetical protein
MGLQVTKCENVNWLLLVWVHCNESSGTVKSNVVELVQNPLIITHIALAPSTAFVIHDSWIM